jgi:hypothetical protein
MFEGSPPRFKFAMIPIGPWGIGMDGRKVVVLTKWKWSEQEHLQAWPNGLE